MINYRELSHTEYYQLLVDLIIGGEGPGPEVYDDGNGYATIGYGYNLVVRSDNLANFQAAGIPLTPTQQDVLEQIDQMVMNGDSRATITDYALNNLDIVLTDGQALDLFEVIIEQYEVNAESLSMPHSYERAALVSLTYNRGANNPRLGPVHDAIEQGDRAEVWFQIRYNSQTSNPDLQNGIAKRRYIESEIFGLYDNSIDATDFISVYELYTQNRATILGYEAKFSSMINVANNDPATQDIVTVQTLSQSLEPAGNYLIDNYVTDLNSGVVIDPLDIQVGDGAVDFMNGTVRDNYKLGEGEAKNDLILSGGGNDVISGGGGRDILYSGSDNDVLDGGEGADYLFGGQGNDVYFATNGDVIEDSDSTGAISFNGQLLSAAAREGGGGGNYTSLDGRFTYGLNGSDLLVSDTVTGDSITVRNFSNEAFGIRLLDIATPPPAVSVYSGDDLGDFIDYGLHILDPGEPHELDLWRFRLLDQPTVPGFDVPFERDGQGNIIWLDDLGNNNPEEAQFDAFNLGAGHDYILIDRDLPALAIHADAGDDYIKRFNGDFLPPNTVGGDFLFGDAGSDKVAGSVKDDYIAGGTDGDGLFGSQGNDILFDNDFNQSDSDNDFLQGGEQNDVLIATGGNDYLGGGFGDDILSGGEDDDVLEGDSTLIAVSREWSASVQRIENQSFLNFFLTLHDPIGFEGSAQPLQGGRDYLYGGAGSDFITGGGDDDVIDGGEGDNDILQGEAGNDVIFGGEGKDFLFGDVISDASLTSGDDRLYGGTGEDHLSGQRGNDLLDGGADNDTLLGGDGDDILLGGDGKDALSGDAGSDLLDGGMDVTTTEDYADTLRGGQDNDVYVYGAGYRTDVIEDEGGSSDRLVINGFTSSDAQLERLADNLLIRFDSGSESRIIIDRFFGAGRIESIQFGNGETWSAADVEARTQIPQSSESNIPEFSIANVFASTSESDALEFTEGNDLYYAFEGNDFALGGGGSDRMFGGEGDDRLSGDEGADQLFSETGNDRLDGGEGADFLRAGVGNDFIDGGSENDDLAGGAGNDYLRDTQGDERYVFDAGWGRDAIEDLAGVDEVVFTEGVDPASIRFMRSGDDLFLYDDGGNQIIFRGWFDDANAHIERISFADGTIWEGETLNALTSRVTGTQGNDSLSGDDASDDILLGMGGNDVLNGLGGDDILEGGDGDDTLLGGAGNDVLNGGAGNDVYAMDTGLDTVQADAGSDEINTVRLAQGVIADDVDAVYDGDNLVLNWGGGNGVTIEGYALSPSSWRFELATGAQVDVETFFAAPVVADAGSSGGAGFVNTALSRYEQYRYRDVVDFWDPQDGPAVFPVSASIVVLDEHMHPVVEWPEGYEPVRVPSGSGEDEQYFPQSISAYSEEEYSWAFSGSAIGSLHRDFLEVVRSDSVAGAQPASVTITSSEGAQLVLGSFALGGSGPSDRQVIGVILDKDIEDGLPDIGSGLRGTATLQERTHFLRVFNLGGGNDDVNMGANAAGSLIDSGAGDDSVSFGNNSTNDLLYGGAGNDFLSAGTGHDILLGGDGSDSLEDIRGNDVLMGMQGDDFLYDEHNRNIFQGGEGHDELNAGSIHHDYIGEHDPNSNEEGATFPTQFGSLLDGGSGNDSIWDGTSSDLIAGGRGDDRITLSGGEDVIAFNRGDGHDLIRVPEFTEQQRTLSLGGGILEQDIRLQRFGNDLVVHTGNAEYIILQSWYEVPDESAGLSPITHLQIIDATGVRQYDFNAIVADFDTALQADPTLDRWTIDGASLAAAQSGDFTDQAIGGNPAYQYGINGHFAGFQAGYVLNIMRNEQFGRANQAFTDTGAGDTYGVLDFANGWIQLQGSGATEAQPNTAPEAGDPIEEQFAGVGQGFQFKIPGNAFNDPDIQDYLLLNYTARLADGSPLPSWLSFNPDTRTFSGQPEAGDFGAFTIEVMVTDGAGQSAAAQFTLEVNEDGRRAIMGTEDDDEIEGAASADRISGLGGDDSIAGNDGDDLIEGGSGNDHLSAGEGNDSLSGGDGNDFLYGDEGNDLLDGGAGNDFMQGGEGNDSLEDNGGGDTEYAYYVFEAGNGGHDVIRDAGGLDYLYIGSELTQEFQLERNGNDLKFVFSPDDSLTIQNWFLSPDHKIENISYENGGELITLTPQDIADILGSVALDTITGTDVGDVIEGTAAPENIHGLGGDDEISGLGGGDFIEAGEGDNIVDAGHGNDSIAAETGDDRFLFRTGDGHDVIEDAGGADSIEITIDSEFMNYWYTRVGEDLIINHSLDDSVTVRNWFLSADHQIETIEIFHEPSGMREISTAAGINDSIENEIDGTDGNDVIAGDQYRNLINGRDGNDSIDGAGGTDRVYGDAGDDVLTGGAGDYDDLGGGSGDDTYIFSRGDGQDIIFDDAGLNRIQFGPDVAAGDVSVTRDPYNLYLNLNNSGGRLVLLEWFSGTEFQMEQVAFADGTVWNAATLESMAIESATEYDDSLYGTAGNDNLDGGDGHDSISGDEGDDTLSGGNGDDQITGEGGDDILLGGEGDDLLEGGSGNDILSSGGGATEYEYYVSEIGDGGHDVIRDAGGVDSIYIVSELTEELQIERNGSDLKLVFSPDDSLTIENWFLSDDHQIESIEYDNWSLGELTVLTADDINDLFDEGENTPPMVDNPIAEQMAEAGVAFNFTVPADTFSDADAGDALTLSASLADGSALPSWLSFDTQTGVFTGTPQAANVMPLQIRVTATDGSAASVYSDFRLGFVGQTLIGTSGNDAFFGGGGDDQFWGNSGNDTLQGNNGNDQLFGDSGNDSLSGSAGDDVINGGSGGDSLDGGAGADQMDGGADSDYAYYTYSNEGVQVSLASGTGAGGHAQGDTLANIENVWGSAWDDTLTGNSGANGLLGGGGNDVISGGDGNDSLYGGAGIDQIYGGAGSDNLSGEAGADLIDGGAGVDYAYYSGASAGVQVDLASGAGTYGDAAGDTLLNIENLVGSSWDDTLFGDANANSLSGGAGSDTLLGRGGNDSLYGEAGDDLVQGGDGDDVLRGDAGNDVVDGGLGNDSLQGGTEDDQLFGGAGDDYLYGDAGVDVLGGGDDSDSLYGGTGADELDGGAGIDYARYSGSTAGVQVDLTADTGAGGDAAGDTLVNIENISGSSFNDTLSGNASANTLSGEAGNDTLSGAGGNDTLYGDAGDDLVQGGDGNDLLNGGAGNDAVDGGIGNDSLYGGTENDQLSGGAGDDYLYGDAGVDVLGGGDGNDSLYGGAGADELDGGMGIDYARYSGSTAGVQVDLAAGTGTGGDAAGDVLLDIEHLSGSDWDDVLTGDAGANFLIGYSGNDVLSGAGGSDVLYADSGNDQLLGGDGNDTLYGNANNDILSGGTGNDGLRGGTGSDVYHFGIGDDQDYVTEDDGGTIDSGSTDRVVFGAGIDTDDLWFTQEGNHLRVWVEGADDWLQVDNWYSNSAPGIEQFETGAGDILLASEVQQLVDAMAVFDPPSSGVLNVSQSAQDEVAPVIAANWS